MQQVCQLVKTAYALQGILAAATSSGSSAAGFLSTAVIGLYSTLITLNVNTAWANIVESAYGGYGRSATIVWRSFINEADGTPTSYSPSFQFRLTNSVTGTNYGGFLVDGTGTSPNLLATFGFSSPINFTNIGDGFNVQIAWNEGTATLNSDADISS